MGDQLSCRYDGNEVQVRLDQVKEKLSPVAVAADETGAQIGERQRFFSAG